VPDTIADLDQRLLCAREAYCQALDEGKLELADTAYHLMDELLDLRLHIPQQHTP
jgi:hypothetical protein